MQKKSAGFQGKELVWVCGKIFLWWWKWTPNRLETLIHYNIVQVYLVSSLHSTHRQMRERDEDQFHFSIHYIHTLLFTRSLLIPLFYNNLHMHTIVFAFTLTVVRVVNAFLTFTQLFIRTVSMLQYAKTMELSCLTLPLHKL